VSDNPKGCGFATFGDMSTFGRFVDTSRRYVDDADMFKADRSASPPGGLSFALKLARNSCPKGIDNSQPP